MSKIKLKAYIVAIMRGQEEINNNFKIIIMASNKFDTEYAPQYARDIKISYTTDWGNTVFEGNLSQVLAHVATLQEAPKK